MIALLAILIAALFAGPAAAQAPEPEEPDIILPEVILRIEDFSVESVESTLPAEEGTLPPARELPLPERDELAITEPVLPVEATQPAEPAAEPAGGQALSALVELGAGSANHVVSQVSLFRQAGDPRFRLRFLHESLDGFSDEASGSGFNLRQDSLEGALKLHLGSLRLDTQGELREEERGLQGQPIPLPASPFMSRVYRHGALSAELAWPISSHWTLSGALGSSFAGQLLTGADPQRLTEVLAEPRLEVELRYPKVWLALGGRYAYRRFLEDGPAPVNREGIEVRMGVDPLAGLHLEASGSWLRTDLLGDLFPFSLSLSAVPSPAFSLLLEGGYRVTQIDARNLLADFPWGELPATILDDRGWYADLRFGFTLKNALSLQTGAHLAWHTALADPSLGQDPATGLFPLDQAAATRLSVEAALRWTPTRQSSLSASWSMQLLDQLTFEPTTEVRLDGEAATASGRWGGRGSLAFHISYLPGIPYTLVPELSLGAFYKASEAIRLVLEGEDLLSPLIESGDRWSWPRSWPPFVEPGIRGTFKVQINL
jgi:hypothetical protein